jgi:hypothetical protein
MEKLERPQKERSCHYYYFEHVGYLDELRWPESSNPHEASFGGSLPHARNNMEHVGLGNHAFEVHYLVKVCQAIVDKEP